MILGFTGTRHIDQETVERILSQHRDILEGYTGYVTGACVGLDGFAGDWLFRAYPEKTHVVVVPANRSQVDYWWHHVPLDHPHYHNIRVIEMPEGTRFKDRNIYIVTSSDTLFYVADYPERHGRSTRSGTWQTVRLARAAELPNTGVIINV